MLNLYIGISPVLVTGLIMSVDKFDNKIFLSLGLSIIAFLILLAVIISKKISAEHKVFEKIGSDNVRILQYFRLFEKGVYLPYRSILNEEAKNMGKGKGYRLSQYLVWFITISLVVIIVILMIPKIESRGKEMELRFKSNNVKLEFNMKLTTKK